MQLVSQDHLAGSQKKFQLVLYSAIFKRLVSSSHTEPYRPKRESCKTPLMDKTLVRTVAQQGQFTTADRIRAFVTDAGGSDDLKATLTKMSSEQRQNLANEYFTKYGKLATDDLIAKVPDQDKYRFRELMAPTDWQRASDSAIAGAAGAGVFHVAFKGIGAGFKGATAALGKDSAGIFAGEGTVVRHADGTHSVVPEGGKYRFQQGETVAEAAVDGASGTKIEFKGVDDNSRRSEVHHATFTEGGAARDVVFHTPEPDYFATTSDGERLTERLGKETTAAKLNSEIGFDANYPESRAYSTQIDGKPVQGWIQDSAGKPITQELKDVVIKRFGNLDKMDEHLPQLLQEQPQLRNDLTNAVVERIVYGDRDINTSNITRGADGKIHNIDMGHAFSDEPAIDLHSYRRNLTDISLLKALSEQPIPADTRAKLQAFADKYKSDEAIDRLVKETGSSRERIVESVQRARQLADSGHLPVVNPTHVTEDNIDFFRIVESSSRQRREAETPVVH